MSFQWLQMRIQEEKDRRKREAITLERLPQALEELHDVLKENLAAYTEAFGDAAVDMALLTPRLKIVVREEDGGHWRPSGNVEIAIVPDLPGFSVERGEQVFMVEVGMLPSGSLYYRDREKDVYLMMEELTRRILDRALFPKLRE